MAKTDSGSFEQLCRAFKGLSAEKKDRVLNTAKTLLAVQENDSRPMFAENDPDGITGGNNNHQQM